MINTSIFKRGLRQLRLKLQSPSISNKKIVDRIAIRKKVLSLHEFESADDETISDSDWGVGSKFQMEAFQFNEPTKKISRIVNVPCDNSLESILKFINESSETDDLRIYKYEEDSDSDKVPQIILTLSSTPSRRALLESILKAFKPLFPKRTIAVDGESDKKADWIVIDLKKVLIHIFDPQTRLEVDLDDKLKCEIGMKLDNSLPKFMANLSNSLPRSIASRPNFIDKFRNKIKN